MKKLVPPTIASLLFIMIMISGCDISKNNIEPKTPDATQKPTITAPEPKTDSTSGTEPIAQDKKSDSDEMVVDGNHLEFFKLAVDVEKLKPFPDPNPDYQYYTPGYEIGYQDDKELSILGFGRAHGNITLLCIRYSDDVTSVEYFPALYFQGFQKPAATDTGPHYFRIGSKIYSADELNDYKVYESEHCVVFSVRDFLPVDTIDEAIEKMTAFSRKYEKTYDYSWLKDAYNYVATYQDIVIK